MFCLVRNTCLVPASTRGISQLLFRHDAYKRKQTVRDYIKDFVVKECQKPGGLDSQGAVVGELIGGCHKGGTDPQELFHAVMEFYDRQGNRLPTIHPKTGGWTYRHHLYIAKDAKDLEANAKAWVASHTP